MLPRVTRTPKPEFLCRRLSLERACPPSKSVTTPSVQDFPKAFLIRDLTTFARNWTALKSAWQNYSDERKVPRTRDTRKHNGWRKEAIPSPSRRSVGLIVHGDSACEGLKGPRGK